MLILFITVLFLGLNAYSAYNNYRSRQWLWFGLSAALTAWCGWCLLSYL